MYFTQVRKTPIQCIICYLSLCFLFLLKVCKGDTVVVNVKNMLEGGEGVSLHWHGVLQEGTPHMDGVTMITQCPIHTHTTFQYR